MRQLVGLQIQNLELQALLINETKWKDNFLRYFVCLFIPMLQQISCLNYLNKQNNFIIWPTASCHYADDKLINKERKKKEKIKNIKYMYQYRTIRDNIKHRNIIQGMIENYVYVLTKDTLFTKSNSFMTIVFIWPIFNISEPNTSLNKSELWIIITLNTDYVIISMKFVSSLSTTINKKIYGSNCNINRLA